MREFNTRMTILELTRTASASGFETVTTTLGNTLGANVSTINPLEGVSNLREIPVDGLLILAEVRYSTTANGINEGDYVRIDSEDYRVKGKSLVDYHKRLIRFNLERVREVQ